jgi:predicted nucleic acid-binding protein
VGTLVVDSSALITLAGADALPLLTLWPGKVLTIPEVYYETVEIGLMKGYPDAAAIERCFSDRAVSTREPACRERLTGIGLVDSLVIRLAEELGAANLLVNDHALLRRAEEHGIEARFTAEFVCELRDERRISIDRMVRLFQAFLERRRYSEEFLNALLMR